MDFRLTEDQRALRRGVRELLAGRFDREVLRGFVDAPSLDRGLWRELGDAGFFSLRLPEAEGGVGLGLPEAVLVFEEAGRVLLPGPLVSTHLAAGAVPGAADGSVVVTSVDEGLVPWLDEADVVLGDVTGAVPVRSVDPLTPLHRLPGTGDGAHPYPPPRTSSWGDPRAERLPTTGLAEATLLTAAEQVGSAQATTDMAVSYAHARSQFGQVIGGFQAVKHLCAGMLVRVELARAAVWAAAVTGDPVEVAGAKLLADDAAVGNARDCLQVHGGMGFTWEADVHLHLKRAWVRAELGMTAARAEETVAAGL
ncbi:acyl-CoA dehydrogenase family protein [Streptomyces vietnamensis]|uniref:Acyl-CoA dehydrogenase n=1 Tax=Streptomyces vietnamensis TaxID=362257 RepID=A0A0B5IE43_9ACTN|nr:acyl-CoA dehydrogenase family protein [Streptomyces vietnamensis]AJF66639.1 acyl-CoA dehydrogenase [Streptomyces vietnamensis]